ncbi:HdeD family acid-resistance protein [Pseudotamlana agarivorans]|uniref:HdeD family acid-resistance protein n=1 Tax=Pseudotamlana agarivorans TaxID=481183 RepID=UPI00082F78BB|nr:DUF308 domain-containing protein [Tamlana agarivorans]
MENSFLKTVRNSIKHWYMHLISGLLFIIVGIYTFTSPLESYLALSILFSISFLISGIGEIIFSISNRHEIDSWGWNLTFGILTFLIGVLLLSEPEISLTTLPFYVGFVLLFRSIMGISFAIELKNYKVLSWGYLLVISFLGLFFSFILLWNPLFAGMTIVVTTGLALISAGVFSIYFAFKLKNLRNNSKNLYN